MDVSTQRNRALIPAGRSLPSAHPGVTVFADLIDGAEAAELGQWALQQRQQGRLKTNLTPQRTFARWRELIDIPPLYFGLRQRVAALAGIEDIEEPVLTSYISVIVAGGAVHPHIDADPPGFRHLRFNVMVSRPDLGGMPIVEDKRIQIPGRGGWWFYPGVLEHSSEVVEGDVPRIVCSYGFLVPVSSQVAPVP